MPILADMETHWDLYLVSTYSTEELREISEDSVKMPLELFINWAVQANI
jgi:hypothetical protein